MVIHEYDAQPGEEAGLRAVDTRQSVYDVLKKEGEVVDLGHDMIQHLPICATPQPSASPSRSPTVCGGLLWGSMRTQHEANDVNLHMGERSCIDDITGGFPFVW